MTDEPQFGRAARDETAVDDGERRKVQLRPGGDDETDVVTRAVRDLATRQDGVVARRQLIALGIRGRTIDRWIAAGRLVMLHRGVYAVGHAAITPHRRIAALLAVAADAVLSHRTAAAAWRVTPEIDGPVELTVPGRTVRSRSGLVVHSISAWQPGDVTRVAGLPHPQTNVRVPGFEVDALWTPQRVIVEVDGWAAHGHRAAFERDRARDAALAALGYVVLRFTWRQLTRAPMLVAARLAAVLSPPGPGRGRG